MFYRRNSHNTNLGPNVQHQDELAIARAAHERAQHKIIEFEQVAASLASHRKANQFAARMAESFRSHKK